MAQPPLTAITQSASKVNLEQLKINDLCSRLEAYLTPEQVAEIHTAYLFGAEAHKDQYRISGEPYIIHPIAVADILASLQLDSQSIIAAILHDVIEDTHIDKAQISHKFSAEVADLVDGVSKLTHLTFKDPHEAQAANFQKMMLAMSEDIRIIMIKLADRTHNMRTLSALPAHKRRRIAHETLDIYAPIANRLGLNTFRIELEDLGLATLYPLRTKILKSRIVKARGNRKEVVGRIETAIRSRLNQEQVHGEISGREKHLFSLYQKMRDKGLRFHEILDVYAYRITVDKVDNCYRTLGVVHSLYKPVPGRFKDYIAIPKANGYQSLHTVLFGPYGVHIEIQIRTHDMDEIAENGIAAHWLYKNQNTYEGYNNAQKQAREWVQGLLEIQKNAGNSVEFLENVKIDLFPDEVYVFTPKGAILSLPKNATAIDFAYAVHTDIGNRCSSIKINWKPAPLQSCLRNGQTVEIITTPEARPTPAWLDFVVTAKARSAIHHYLKKQQNWEAVVLGKRLLEHALHTTYSSLGKVPEQRLKNLLNEFGYDHKHELFQDIGQGVRMAPLVAKHLLPNDTAGTPRPAMSQPLTIKGTEGVVVTFAKCCCPIPGDSIMGFLTTGKGIVIHQNNCRSTHDLRQYADKWLAVQWAPDLKQEFSVDIHIGVNNRRGVLANIASTISELDTNIENVKIHEHDHLHSRLHFTITVKNRTHLAKIIKRIRTLHAVNLISRTQY